MVNTIAEDDMGGARDRGEGFKLERNSSGSRRRKPQRAHPELDRTVSAMAGLPSSQSGQSSPRESSPKHFDMRSMSQELTRAEQQQQSTRAVGGGGGGGNGGDPKKERIRNLWGKMANKGIEQSEGSAGGGAGGGGGKKKWDQLLLKKRAGGGGGAAGFAEAAAAAYYAAQQQQAAANAAAAAAAAAAAQQQQQSAAINYMNAPNQSTTQCDCGDDSCPFCNLLLNMEMTDPNMLM